MASAQVLSNSSSSAAGAGAAASSSARKQGHLEAGKKRLEEFRKKKAAKKAAALTEQAAPAVPDPTEKLPPNASGANSTDGPASDVESSAASTTSAPSGVYQNGPLSSARSAEFSNGPTALKEPVGVSNIGGQVRDALSDERTNLYGSLSFSNLANGHHENWIGDGACRGKEYSSDKDDQSLTSTLRAYGNNNSSKFPSFIEVLPNWHKNSLSSQTHDTQQSRPSFLSSPFEKSESTYSQDYSGNSDILGQFRATTSKGSSQMEHSVHTGSLEVGSTFSNSRGERMVDLIDRDANVETNHQNVSDSTSANFDKQDPFPSTSYPSMYSRSRPSFLDSIGVQRAPPTSQATYNEPAKVNPALTSSNSKFESASYQQPNQLFAGSNTVEHSLRSGTQEANDEKESSANSIPPNSVSSNNEQTLKHGNETFHNFTTHGKDDDFTALEQLIEDLTQEKFSLQRTLEKSQALAQNLATDNSALTDKFNQQAQVISQLTSDMERLQGEIQAQLLALESVKMEYANAQLECNAADERAKVLAAEVILLEDKALRLRSNELKLGKEVEDLKSEISSYRRKVSSLEKDRQHFQSTIDALQEEKKLLQSKLRNLPVTEKVNIPEKHPIDKRDASTATEDLDTGESSSSGALLGTINTSEDAGTTSSMSNDISGISSFEEVPSRIPDDQLRMIDNINSLMSELSVEREELLRALRIESSNCSNLKELNKDLTQKLEIQTNRLELLTAQRMASENALAKPIDMPSINDATIYADEGDEVVERVLGWIMKLFPGGPKRRTSKLL